MKTIIAGSRNITNYKILYKLSLKQTFAECIKDNKYD